VSLAQISSPKEVRITTRQISIPQEIGEIEEIHESPASTGLVLHIRDAHGNYEAQRNIEKIITHLNTQYGIELLLLEGGSKELTPDLFRFFSEKKLNLRVYDLLMKKAEFSGAESALMTAEGELNGYGIENPEDYREDLGLFRSIVSREEETEGFIRSLENELHRVGSHHFSPDLRDFIKEWRQYRSERSSLLRFVPELARTAQRVLSLDLEDPYSQWEWPSLLILR